MAGFGPPPKENRRRRNADTFAAEPEAAPIDAATAPPLPTPKRWLKVTRDWWETWAASGQSAHFTATDWQRLLALLPLVDSYHRLTSSANAEDTRKMRAALEIMKEIRQNESGLGALHVDRLRGRMTSTAQTTKNDGPSAELYDLSAYSSLVKDA
ncbi:phage terminase small subunit [Kitasatospora sp. NPDC001132]